jgi:hypothetical protein
MANNFARLARFTERYETEPMSLTAWVLDEIRTEVYDHYRQTDAGTLFEFSEYTAWREIYEQTQWIIDQRRAHAPILEQFKTASMVLAKFSAEQIAGRICGQDLKRYRRRLEGTGERIRKKVGI